MSKQEKAKFIEKHLPSIENIIDEYKTQGKTLTTAEAEVVRDQLRRDLASGHIDAMENVLGDDVLEKVAGGGGCQGGVPTPTATPPEKRISISPELQMGIRKDYIDDQI